MERIATIHGMDCQLQQQSWTSAPDLAAAREQLAQGGFTHVAAVHHETTSGRLNDLAALAKLAREFAVELLIDGVSSFGAESLQFDHWPIAACAATANKCLHGVPGISFVLCRRAALANAATRSLYLDLNRYAAEQDRGGTPFTQSVQCCYALDAALAECLETGGWQARRELFQRRMHIVRSGFIEADIEPLLREEESSCVLNAFRLPRGVDYPALHDHLKQAGFVIYAGQGEFAQSMFRIAVMGELPDTELQRLVGIVNGEW